MAFSCSSIREESLQRCKEDIWCRMAKQFYRNAASFMRTSRLPCFSQRIFMSHLFTPRMRCISSWLTNCQLNVDYKSLHSHLTSVGGTKKTSVGRKESENSTWSSNRPACRPHSCCLISFKQSYYQKSPEFAYRVL